MKKQTDIAAIGQHFSDSGEAARDLNRELRRTAEMLVQISKTQGVYFVVAFLLDSQYDLDRIRKLLPFLQAEKGSILSTEARPC